MTQIKTNSHPMLTTGRQLVDRTLYDFQQELLKGNYHEGDKLPSEAALKEQFHVGRSTLREAVKILVHTGVLHVRQGDGTYIASLAPLNKNQRVFASSESTAKEIIEARNPIEIEIAGLAASRRTKEDLFRMEQALQKRNHLLNQGAYSEYTEADMEFHLTVSKACNNDVLQQMYESLSDSLLPLLRQLVIDNDTYDDLTPQHEDLYYAIARQDVEDAKRAVKHYLGKAHFLHQ